MVIEIQADTKCCSRCDETKPTEKFIKKRNICKECSNSRKKQLLNSKVIDETSSQKCNVCAETKLLSSFIKHVKTCYACNNEKRRNRYSTDEEFRKKVIQERSALKHQKVLVRRQAKLDEIGEGNKKCSICSTIKPECNFRYNRLKCRNCERDDPVEKFKRNVRGRIHSALKKCNGKSMNTIKYLGMSSCEYLQWILHNDKNYTLENRSEWHIDHVIPLSRFDLDNEAEQLIAFNWRNTMPLDAKDNLKKNSKLDLSQIEQHYKKLSDYHKQKNIELPQVFIDLFAKRLVAGTPLEPSLPL
jgi:uncharacterized protein (DUF983 family)